MFIVSKEGSAVVLSCVSIRNSIGDEKMVEGAVIEYSLLLAVLPSTNTPSVEYAVALLLVSLN